MTLSKLLLWGATAHAVGAVFMLGAYTASSSVYVHKTHSYVATAACSDTPDRAAVGAGESLSRAPSSTGVVGTPQSESFPPACGGAHTPYAGDLNLGGGSG